MFHVLCVRDVARQRALVGVPVEHDLEIGVDRLQLFRRGPHGELGGIPCALFQRDDLIVGRHEGGLGVGEGLVPKVDELRAEGVVPAVGPDGSDRSLRCNGGYKRENEKEHNFYHKCFPKVPEGRSNGRIN